VADFQDYYKKTARAWVAVKLDQSHKTLFFVKFNFDRKVSMFLTGEHLQPSLTFVAMANLTYRINIAAIALYMQVLDLVDCNI
jgi:hypothetical protein